MKVLTHLSVLDKIRVHIWIYFFIIIIIMVISIIILITIMVTSNQTIIFNKTSTSKALLILNKNFFTFCTFVWLLYLSYTCQMNKERKVI